MNKRFLTAMLSLLMAACAAGASAQLMYVDNHETDKIHPERLNLRAEASAMGDLLGLYYSGTKVDTLDESKDGYMKVTISGVTGYMSEEYLIDEETARLEHGEDPTFFEGRAAQVDLSGMWMASLPIYETPQEDAQLLGNVAHGAKVSLWGIVGDGWAYVTAPVGEEEMRGYVQLNALTDVEEYKALVIAGEKADSRLILYSMPNTKSKVLMSLKNGTTCFNLFARSVGGWRKVRVGGVTGWIREMYTPGFELLSETPRGSIPYYPLLMQTKKETLLYSVAGDVSSTYMTLGKDMKVEVLAESEDYAYVRTFEGGAGAYDRGDYGYIALSELSLTASDTFVALAQVDEGDLPAVVLAQPDPQAELLGALCAGAQVRITDFTQTDYMQVQLGGGEDAVKGYVLKDSLRMLTGAADELSDRIPQRASLIRAYELTGARDDQAATISLSAGDRVYMYGVVNGLAYVRAGQTPNLDPADDAQDATGFVELSALNAPASTTHLTAFVHTDKVNIRKEGSVSAGIIGKARLEERLRVADYGTEWTCVVKEDGTRGYVKTEYLVFEQEGAKE